MSWVDLDDRRRWQYTVEGDEGKILVRDRVEDIFKGMYEVLMGVG